MGVEGYVNIWVVGSVNSKIGLKQYTGCPAKHVPLLFFLISWLPRGLEIQSWPFSNSPFRADFKNIQFFYYLVISGSSYCKNTAGCSFLKLTFFNNCSIKYLRTHLHS